MLTLTYRIGFVVALLLLLPALTLPTIDQYGVRWVQPASIRLALLSLPLRELRTPVSGPKCLLDESPVWGAVKPLCLFSNGRD